jgi:GNAT superfamily N-acetyltransferase
MYEPISDGVIRKLWITEACLYRDHLLRLDPHSRHSRFGASISDERVRDYVEDSILLKAIIHGFFADGVLRGAAELRPVGPGFSQTAEGALSVEDEWQSQGVGAALLVRTLLAARNRGFRSVHLTFLAENHRMRQLARDFEGQLRLDSGSVTARIATARATGLSLVREFVNDVHGLAIAALDVQARLLRPA